HIWYCSFFFFSSRRRHTRFSRDWSSDVCSSDLEYDGIIIVPMTIVNPQYFEEIVGRLRVDGIIVNHFVLWASKETLKKRLRSRGERKNSWGEQQIDRCLQGLSDDVFEKKIHTDDMTIEQVAETIAEVSGITLLPDNRSNLRKKIDRIKTQLQHFRL